MHIKHYINMARCTCSLFAYHPRSVYHSVAEPLVDAVLDGFNAAVLCYGQTGAGKSYTV